MFRLFMFGIFIGDIIHLHTNSQNSDNFQLHKNTVGQKEKSSKTESIFQTKFNNTKLY